MNARFWDCGRVCTCNERTYAHGGLYDEFVERFIRTASAIKMGDPMATSGALSGLVGALIGAGQPVAGAGWELDVISAVVEGGTLLTGGAGTLSGTLAGVLLGILQNLINQLGTLGSYTQQLVSGVFLIAVVLIQAYLTRKQRS